MIDDETRLARYMQASLRVLWVSLISGLAGLAMYGVVVGTFWWLWTHWRVGFWTLAFGLAAAAWGWWEWQKFWDRRTARMLDKGKVYW